MGDPIVFRFRRTWVAKRHRELGDSSGASRYANLAMRFLRSLFNFAIAEYEDGFGQPLLTTNPVAAPHADAEPGFDAKPSAGSHQSSRACRLGAKQPARLRLDRASRSPIPVAGLSASWLLFHRLPSGAVSAAAAHMDRVSLQEATLRIVDTKNREPHLLPLGRFLVELLEARKEKAQGGSSFRCRTLGLYDRTKAPRRPGRKGIRTVSFQVARYSGR